MSSLTVFAMMPVLTFFKVTVAPGTMAPVESRTVPSTLAVSNWAKAAAVDARIATGREHEAACDATRQ